MVLEAWRRWGPDALPRFRGMFAFALYDERSRTVTLVRDPLGIKPMYVMPRGERHPVRFRAQGIGGGGRAGAQRQPSVRSSRRPCSISCRRNSRAIKEVFKLPPGSWAEWRADGTSRAGTLLGPRRGSSRPPQPVRPRTSTTVLEESVAAHLVADVPVASFLSGGLDSSLITALAASRDPAIEAYTITFRPEDQRLEAMPDDAVYARKMAAHLGIRLHEIEISPDVVDMLPRIVDVLDEPIGDPAAINTVLMCQAARDAGVKVLLSGMGADELFGGYRKHLACLLGARYQTLPQSLRVRAWSRRAWTGSPSRPAGAGFGTAAGPSASSPSPSCRRRRRSAAATPSTTRTSCGAARPGAGTARCDDVVDAHARLYTDNSADRPRQPDVPGRHPPVPARAQPRLHRPGEHGGLDRGTRAVRRPVRLPGGVQLPRRPEDPGPDAEGSAARRRRGLAAARRASTARRPRSGLRCAPGSPTTSGL